ncbi:MAG: O-antigen ligase family protein [Coriobacteriia bacterium]
MGLAGTVDTASRARLLRVAVPGVVTLLWCLVLAAPASLKPLVANIVGVGGGAALLAVVAAYRRSIGKGPSRVAALLVIGGGALFAGALAHPRPLVSIAGAVGQHNGWMLWAAVLLWFVSGAAMGRGTSLRWTMWSLAVAGAVSAVFAVLDVAGLAGAVRYSAEAAGVMESSISLGQLLLVGFGCAAALFCSEIHASARWTAAGFALLQAAVLMLSGARAAVVLGVAATVLAVLWARRRDDQRLDALLRWGAGLGVAVLIIGVVAVAWTGAPDNAALRGLLTDRPAIWHSAFLRMPDHLLLGAGPDRFSAIVNWSAVAGDLEWQTTSSPHNVLFDWVLGGGIVALAAYAAGFITTGMLIGRNVARAGQGPKLLALFLGAWALSLLTSWIDPLAACAAAVLAGGLSSEPAVLPSARFREALLGRVAVVVAVTTCVLVWPLMGIEVRWAEEVGGGPAPLSELIERWERWPDPAFGGQALEAAIEGLPATATEADTLAEEVLERTPWDANGALRSLQASLILRASVPPADAPDPEVAVETGRQAAPASDIWDWVDETLLGR